MRLFLTSILLVFATACSTVSGQSLPPPAAQRQVDAPAALTVAQPTAAPAVTTNPPTPAAPPALTDPAQPITSDYAAALLPEFKADLNLIRNPTIYQMTWQLNDDLTRLEGSQHVRFANSGQSPLAEVYFRLFANYPDSGGSIQVNRVIVNSSPVTPQFEVQNTALRVPLAQPLAPGGSVQIDLDYVVSIPVSASQRYSDFTTISWITTLPTIYPLIPAYDESGWHTELPPPYGDLVYAPSAFFDVRVIAPERYTVIASGQTVDKQTASGQTSWHVIAAPVRDFALVLTSTLTHSSISVNGTTVNSYYLPDHSAAGESVLKWASDALQVFNERIGAYPFRELDVIETPTTAGGIEYPGLVVLASSLYTNLEQQNFFEYATAHEVAHQWWYSTVGNDQVNAPWLDESLVQYTTTVYFEDMYGKATANLVRERTFQAPYQNAVQHKRNLPANLPVNAYAEGEYGEMVYGKAPLFFDAVRKQLGDAKFFAALRAYYQQEKYQLATPQKLLNILNSVGGQDITPLYDKWIASGS